MKIWDISSTLISGETKEKEERTRSSKTSRSHKSKSLSCYGGLASFSAVKSLMKSCMSQNCFTFIKNKKIKSSSTWLIPASLCEGPFFYFYVESVFLFLLIFSSNNLVSTLVHVIFLSNCENFVFILSWDKQVASWSFCWKLKSSFVLAKLLCWINIALWFINHCQVLCF